MLNYDLLLSPYNWAAVILMALLGLALLAILSPESSQ